MQIPARARLVAPRDALAFLDSQSVRLPCDVTPLEAWRRIMANPLPGLQLAFRIRDAISAQFGVKRIGGFSRAQVTAPQVGDRLDFFLIEQISDTSLTLSARDRHLDVVTSVTTDGAELAITSSVVTHNRFGRAYMLPVGPAHRLIVRIMLRRLQRGMAF